MPLSLVLAASLSVLTGCQGAHFDPNPTTAAMPVVELGHGSLTVHVPTYGLRTLPSGPWTANDVYEYRVVVQKQDTGGTAQGVPMTAVLPQKGSTTSTSVTFTSLVAGYNYNVSLEAWGNTGGSAASTKLNSQTPSSQLVTFSGNADLDDQQAVNLAATLDSVFSNTPAGPAVVTFGSPAPAGFLTTGDPAASVPAAVLPTAPQPYTITLDYVGGKAIATPATMTVSGSQNISVVATAAFKLAYSSFDANVAVPNALTDYWLQPFVFDAITSDAQVFSINGAYSFAGYSPFGSGTAYFMDEQENDGNFETPLCTITFANPT